MIRNFASLVLLLFVGCTSMKSDSGLGNAKVAIPDPEMQIQQISAVPAAASHVEGGIPVRYALAILNHAAQPITLKQVSIVSMGMGAYNVPSSSRPFKVVIEPQQTKAVDFWLPASIDNASIVGANGPVTLRVTAYFDSPLGQFQHVVVQQVNSTASLGQ